ncbi:MAG: dTDP-4-dehydrorhamnose reductase [Planctomycetota bacterium]|jgi:dTDP-4-dehydrorhamnose reductase
MSNVIDSNRVLVLGGSGFLGTALLEAMSGKGREVLSASRKPGERPRAEGDDVRDVALDLENAGAATTLIQLLQPKAVLLVAALSRMGDCEQNPERAQRLNAEAASEVARACALADIRLLYTSTDLVFDGEPPRESGYVESDPVSANSIYGQSKAAGEAAVLNAHPEALVVRLPLLFGNSRGRGLGASDSLLAALAHGDSPGLFTDEWRTPLDVDQAAKALVELLDGSQKGRLHLAGPERISRYDFGCAVLKANHRTSEINSLRAVTRADLGLADRPRDVSLDTSLARDLIRAKILGVNASLEKP